MTRIPSYRTLSAIGLAGGVVCAAAKALFLAPGFLLLFSLSFARPDYQKHLSRWKYILIASFVLPVAALPYPRFFYSVVLILSVLVLSNLERTLRVATGHIRYQVKFVVLGAAILCATWIFLSSQVLIYASLDPSLEILHPVSLLLACIFFGWGLARSHFLKVDVYLSRATIQYSLTGIIVSSYLVLTGIAAYLARVYNPDRFLALDALIILVALAGLALLLLSDRRRERTQRFVTRYFKRPVYDYRKTWMDFTEKTNSLIRIGDLCTGVARIVSQTFGVLSVNIWLCDEAHERLALGGSTVFTGGQTSSLERRGPAVRRLLKEVQERAVLELNGNPCEWADDIMRSAPEFFDEYRMRYIVPIRTGANLVGIMTLNSDRVGKAPLSLEDVDLLNAYASHLGARVLQLRLSENLRKVQEVEAFQNVSTFFVHDLKNIASRLSLTMQNLPAYFDNPDFRADAFRLIGESVAKIDSTIGRLSSVRRISVKPVPGDLNALLESTLKDVACATQFEFEKEMGALPAVSIDPEQMQTVFYNLVMNAYDAIKGQGSIKISTTSVDHKVVCSIADNGCGMSREFVDKLLFRPFNSTKKRGMGIGLFHSKMIVEAHKGTIEVESEPGKGTTFRVVLPIYRNATEGNTENTEKN